MSAPLPGAAAIEPPDVAACVEEHRRIRGWLARLADRPGGAPPRAVELVQQDYRQRLEAIVERLTRYAAEVEASAALAADRMTHAPERRAAARLRHALGEFDAAALAVEEAAIANGEAEAQAARDRLQRELAGVRAAIEQLAREDGNAAAPVPPPSAGRPPTIGPQGDGAAAVGSSDPASQPAGERTKRDMFAEWEPAAGSVDAPEPEEPPVPPQTADSGDDDLAFLRDLPASWKRSAPDAPAPAPPPPDRTPAAIAPLPPPPAAPATPGQPEEAPQSVHSTSGLLCRMCGSSNDPFAWYCNSCGAELG